MNFISSLFDNVGFFTNDIESKKIVAKAVYHSGKFVLEHGIEFLQWLYN